MAEVTQLKRYDAPRINWGKWFLIGVGMLVSAFMGREHALAAYQEAVRERYRFFSFGDCMLIGQDLVP